MRWVLFATLLAGCPSRHLLEEESDGGVDAACEALEAPVAFTDARLARLAVRGDAPLLAWTDDATARVGAPGREPEALATGARAIDVAPTEEGYVAAIALEGSIRVVELAGDERRVSTIEADTRQLSVGALGARRLLTFDVGDDSSALAVGRGDAWERVPLGRVRSPRLASDGASMVVAATGFDGLTLVAHDGLRLGEIATLGGGTRAALDVDVGDGRGWVVAVREEAEGARVEVHGWDGRRWGEPEPVTTLDDLGLTHDVAIAASPEPRVFVTVPTESGGAIRAFVRRAEVWTETSALPRPAPAFPSASGGSGRWGVAWQDAERRELGVWTDRTEARALAAGDHRLPQLALGDRCTHVSWSEWIGTGYRSWYWRGR